METHPVEVFSEATNFAIVRMPGRTFPGCVVQGDSLAILLDTARALLTRAADLKDETLVASATEVVEALQSRLDHYERVLAEHDFPLPYTKRQ